jgi:outer membrane protein assembly factor BamB
MKSPPIPLTLVFLSLLLCEWVVAAGVNWPQFRGPQAGGVSETAAPLTWNLETGENVRWQTPVPGLAHASPIIWESRLYLTTAVRPGAKPDLKIGLYGDGKSYTEKEPHQWRLLCLDKATGKILWDKLGHESVPRLERHSKATHCNSTPATDGKRIVAMFGSEGSFCFDMDGQTHWRKDLGKLHAGPYDSPGMQWGFASSPVLHEGKVIVQCDTLSEQFLAVFDATDGRLYFTGEQGDVFVLAATNQFSVLATNQLGGISLSTPAISEGVLFFRTTEKMLALGFKPDPKPKKPFPQGIQPPIP